MREIGSGAFTLVIHGNNFVAGAVVTFNGQNRATTFISPQQLSSAMLASDVSTAGTFTIAVVHPGGGGTSNPAAFVVNGRPEVTIVAPAANAVFEAPASIMLEATATDGDGIRQVEFFQGAATVGVDLAAPYSISWGSVPEGTYRLTAVATDNRGMSTTSAPVDVTVRAAAPLNASRFVSQSVPALMVVGRKYKVSVTMQNTGNTTWTSAGQYNLGSQGPRDNVTWGLHRTPLSGTVPPGAQTTFLFTVTAPASPGNYVFQWGTVQDGKEWFGDPTPPVSVRAEMPVNASRFVSQSVPTVMVIGQPYSVTVTMENIGTTTWTAADDYNLGSQGPRDNMTWGLHRTPVSKPVAPGEQARFQFTVTAPASPGSHVFQWGTVQDGKEWFGDPTPPVTVRTEPPVNASRFVSQWVPAAMIAGRTYTVSVTMENSGTTTWTSAGQYNLGSQGPRDNTTWGLHRTPLAGPVPPGAQTTFQFTVTAPLTPANYVFQWATVQDGKEWFGNFTPAITVPVLSSAKTGLIASWNFDEGSGSTTMDATGNGSAGTADQLLNWTAGRSNSALRFVSTAPNVVRIAPSPKLSALSNDFTVSFWAQPQSAHEIDVAAAAGVGGTAGQKYVMGPRYEPFGDAGMGISVGTNGVSLYEHGASHMPAVLVYSSPISGWTHIAVAYENKRPTLYVNGAAVQVGEISVRTNIYAVPADIGGMAYGNYDGLLDEVRIHDSALSAATIASMAGRSAANAPSNTMSLGLPQPMEFASLARNQRFFKAPPPDRLVPLATTYQ
jgi:hypothetical protein